VRTLARHSRWRRAVVTACLPYILVSVFVDFLHEHREPGAGTPVVLAGHTVPLPGSTNPASLPESKCPVCAWLRVGPRLETPVTPGAPTFVTPTEVATVDEQWPDSPVPPPSAFRGPPSSLAL